MKREVRISGVRRLFSLPLSRRSIDREIDDEIRFHMESRVEELVSRGLSTNAARAQAEHEFGDLSAARRDLGRVDRRRHASHRRGAFLESLVHDLRYAIRGLRRQPGFAAIVIFTLAVGIGANAVVFGLVDRLLLSPPPHVTEPDRVVRIHLRERIGDGEPSIGTVTNYPIFPRLKEQVKAFSDVSAYFRTQYSLGQGAEAREVDVMLVEGHFHQLLGVRPAVGRLLLPSDDTGPDGLKVAVLSHGLWQRQFGASEAVVGSTILLGGNSFEIVGVAPPGFNGVDLDNADIWVPLSAVGEERFGPTWRTEDRNTWARGIARLAPHATQEQAAEEGTGALRRARAEWARSGSDTLATIVPGSLIASRGPEGASREARVSMWLMGVSVIVLLIACANILNLLLSRAMQRQREMAVRLAVGVGRVRLARQLLTETLLLTTIAMLAAAALGHWGGRAMAELLLPGIPWAEGPMNPRVFGFTALTALVTLLFAGVLPAVRSTRTDVSTALRTSGRGEDRRGSTLRNFLLVTQTSLCVLLLVGAGLFAQSLRNVRELDVGVDLDRAILVHMNLSSMGFDRQQQRDMFQQATERVRGLPGVQSASLIVASTPTRGAFFGGFQIPGRDSLPSLPDGGPYITGVDADYFRTIGARVVRGRAMTEAEVLTGARVLVVNQTIADTYWPGADPVGECVVTDRDDSCSEVIGVVQNILNFRMLDDSPGSIYVPHGHPALGRIGPSALLVREAAGAPSLIVPIQREVQSLAPNMPYVNAAYFGQIVAPQLQAWRLGAAMFSIFGVVAMLIAMVGLYGVIAYLVTRRTHEIGIRMALGAQRGEVLRMILGQGMRVVLIGVVLGTAAAFVAGRYLGDLLYETSPAEPRVLTAVAVTLSIVAIAATLAPSLRASRVDPAVALRSE